MGSALLDHSAVATQPSVPECGHWIGTQPSGEAGSPAVSALRREAAARLAAHRSHRREADSAPSVSPAGMRRNTRSAKIAAAVAERYAQTPSYKDFLAAETERVVQQARAAAEVAAMKAEALAAAQRSLLDALQEEEQEVRGAADQPEERPGEGDSPAPKLEREPFSASLLWPDLAPEKHATERRPFQPPVSRRKQAKGRDAGQSGEAAGSGEVIAIGAANDRLASTAAQSGGITIRLYQDENGATQVTFGSSAKPRVAFHLPVAPRQDIYGPHTEEEARLLDEEIAFRREPVFEEPAGPPVPLPANLIEFPRQLVASRKARPRLAEGPLRDEDGLAAGEAQLRIFEVDPAQIETVVESDAAAAAESSAQWTTIWLDSQPQARAVAQRPLEKVSAARAAATGLADVASPRRRILSAGINAAVIAVAFAAFSAVGLWVAAHVPMRAALIPADALLTRAGLQTAAPFAVGAFALLGAIYQALFFAFSTATPGMRCARIALCTFSGENPTRGAVRRRLLALLLSAAPMGLGFVWAALDEERLSWHDRLCGIYQRSY
ncbi:MAG TPA: RDD family protein [Acidobacteriaceae bacterium]|nr:RDD family protein [Acidobacteriaceae bacterium]